MVKQETKNALMRFDPTSPTMSMDIVYALQNIPGAHSIVHREGYFPNGIVLGTTGQPQIPSIEVGMHRVVETHKGYRNIVVPMVLTGMAGSPPSNHFDNSLGMISRIGNSLRGGQDDNSPQFLNPDSRLFHFLIMADVRQDKYTEIEEGGRVIEFYGEADNSRILAKHLKLMGNSDGVVALDYHSHRATERYATEGLPFVNITAAGKFKEWLDKHGYVSEDPSVVIVTSDTGDLTRAWELSKRSGILIRGITYKTRADEELTARLQVLDTDLKNKKVIIWDDMISSGGTLKRDAEILFEQGIQELVFMATHPVLVGEYMQTIRDLTEKYKNRIKIITTNSIFHPQIAIPFGVERIDISDVITQATKILLEASSFNEAQEELQRVCLVHNLESPSAVLDRIERDKVKA